MLDYNVKYMRLASCSDDRSARIWNIQEILKRESSQIPGLSDSNSEAVVLIGHKNNVSTVDWCPVDYPGVGPIVATYVDLLHLARGSDTD
jgi:WD40 repeat protein